jgi:hypothetical protein
MLSRTEIQMTSIGPKQRRKRDAWERETGEAESERSREIAGNEQREFVADD